MSSTIREAQEQARSKMEGSWKNIARDYTAAWMEPIEAVEMYFPHVSANISDIRRAISLTLPIIVYQTRQSPPENTTVAVAYEAGDAPHKCRLIATNQLTTGQRELLAEFAQALWFLIESKALPSPREGKAFEKRLIEMTDA